MGNNAPTQPNKGPLRFNKGHKMRNRSIKTGQHFPGNYNNNHFVHLPTMEIRIEPYTDQYKQQVIELISTIQQEEFNIPITPEEQPDLQQIPGFYQKDNGNFWLAIADSSVVGTIALLDIGNKQGALRKMFVKQNYRGKEYGTGQLLLNTLLVWARQKGYAEIYLGTTEKFLAAHRFYKKNNFTAVAVTELPASFPRMGVDVKFYRYGV
jgi:GNAT superfamily N-acetyltransferase